MTSAQQQRRKRLLTAAQRAIVLHGPDARLKDIADEAGLTSGAVLYHFPDVQALLLEANRAGTERFLERRLRAAEGLESPAEKLVLTIEAGLPVDADDADVQLLCTLGGAAARYPVYAALLTALFDRQVAMYQVILESGVASGEFRLRSHSLAIGRNIVALEDAYGYRLVARHATLDVSAATELILDYVRLATDHELPTRTRVRAKT